MRVLHICDGRLYGGVERILATLAQNQDCCPDLKHEFALCFEDRLARELHDAGAIPHRLGHVRLRDPLSIWRGRRILKSLLATGRFDVVLVHMALQQALFGPVVTRGGVPLVVWQHGPFEEGHWLERWAGTTAPRLAICNSRFTASLYRARYPHVPREMLYCPVALTSHALSQPEREAVRKDFDTPPGAVVIIQVSRMEPWKGHLTHLEALARLIDNDGWVCWFVGGVQSPAQAAYNNKVHEAARAFGVAGRVRFLGDRRDVPRLLRAADIFCQPNTAPEPFGIAFIEALAAGLPAVGSALGGTLEIVDSSCGELVAPRDADGLSQALRRLIDDPSARRSARPAAIARARQLCDPHTQVARLAGILANL